MESERAARIVDVLSREGYRAVVCRLPEHVVMLTGYQPVLGNSFCVASLNQKEELEIRLLVPGDEANLVRPGTATTIKTFSEETLDYISTTIPSVRQPLTELLEEAGLRGRMLVGFEGGRSPVATTYTQIGIPGDNTLNLLREILPEAHWRDATDALEELASVKTQAELVKIRQAEEVARQGFLAAHDAVRVGASEADVHGATYAALLRAGYGAQGVERVLAHVHVMAGTRAALAYQAFNLTSGKTIEPGDTVSVQMEVSLDGYWAELTRPFFAEEADDTWRRAHAACVAAQDAAMQVIRAGISGHDADAAARDVMRSAGFGDAFKHGLGHGFGFQAINHAAAPILHPASQQVLRANMVHNMEPAVYLDGKGGIRLNDNVLVNIDGGEVISSAIPRDLDWLVVKG